jgi:hypothetical protein
MPCSAYLTETKPVPTENAARSSEVSASEALPFAPPGFARAARYDIPAEAFVGFLPARLAWAQS